MARGFLLPLQGQPKSLHLLEAQGTVGSGPRWNLNFFYLFVQSIINVRSRGMFVGFLCRSPVSCIHPTILARTCSLLPGQCTQVIIQTRLSLVPPSNLEMDLQCFPDRRGVGGTRLGAVSSLL